MTTPAMDALYRGDPARGRALLNEDDSLDVFHAAAFGRHDRLAALLGRDPALARAVSGDGFTALHLAVFGGQLEAARTLIAGGADLDAVSEAPFAAVTPLGTAAFVRSTALARVLLDAGADVDGCGLSGFTPLHTAAENDDVELVTELLARGADPRRPATDGRTPVDLAAPGPTRDRLSEAG